MKSLTLSLFLIACTSLAWAQSAENGSAPAPKLTRNMKALLVATNLINGADTLYLQMTEAFLRKDPAPGKPFFKRLKARCSEKEMMKVLVPVLVRHFTDEQMGEMARAIPAKEFDWETPEMDAFMLEASETLAKWAFGIFDHMKEEYQREVEPM